MPLRPAERDPSLGTHAAQDMMQLHIEPPPDAAPRFSVHGMKGSEMTGPSMPHASATDSYGTDIKTRVEMCAGGATQRKPLTSSHLEH